ncbi:reverse transcriptase domain-containing protein [Endozoicomonas lisbonensis]|uniref:Reverse transcriptase domain-containing protein n=1 Tax=Endozoicomonas lisbonensis TaxID=3120522 RepID=A0ABV2SCZ9_9GAMM
MPSQPKWISKFQIKSGTWVFVPSESTVKSGKLIKRAVESKWTPPDYYYHLRDGGHVLALKSHVMNDYFVHLDLKSFFSSVSRSRITRTLKYYFGYEAAREVAVESTVTIQQALEKSHILPFGFVQSPILASLCLRKSKLGKVLHKINQLSTASISVYVDDIIISTKDKILAKELLLQVKEAAERSRFPLNYEKEEGPAESITAFNIELSHDLMEVSPSRLVEFQEQYQKSENFHKLAGIVGYVYSVNPTQSQAIR